MAGSATTPTALPASMSVWMAARTDDRRDFWSVERLLEGCSRSRAPLRATFRSRIEAFPSGVPLQSPALATCPRGSSEHRLADVTHWHLPLDGGGLAAC